MFTWCPDFVAETHSDPDGTNSIEFIEENEDEDEEEGEEESSESVKEVILVDLSKDLGHSDTGNNENSAM